MLYQRKFGDSFNAKNSRDEETLAKLANCPRTQIIKCWLTVHVYPNSNILSKLEIEKIMDNTLMKTIFFITCFKNLLHKKFKNQRFLNYNNLTSF